MSARLAAIRDLGCCICGRTAIIHHIPPGHRRGGDDRHTWRDDRYVIPLCPTHHNMGGYGVAIHSGRVGWEERHGTAARWLDWVDERMRAHE